MKEAMVGDHRKRLLATGDNASDPAALASKGSSQQSAASNSNDNGDGTASTTTSGSKSGAGGQSSAQDPTALLDKAVDRKLAEIADFK